MSTRRINRSWWVDLRHEGLRYRLKSPDDSFRGAQAYELVVRNRLARGEAPVEPPPPAPMKTFSEFVPEWLRNYVDANNKHSERISKRSILRVNLEPFFGNMPLDAIGLRDIERYKAAKLASGISAKTVNNHLTVLNKALQTASEWGLIESVPEVKWLRPMKPSPRYLTADEAARLIDSAEPRPWREMIVLALHTGMRLGELLALDWTDVNLDLELLVLRRAAAKGIIGTPKSNRYRTIPLSQEASRALRELQGQGHLPQGFVFTVDARMLMVKAAAYHLKKAAKLAGIENVHWHALRHTFATLVLRGGASTRDIQALLGHSSIAMTEHYTHVWPEALRGAVHAIDLGPRNKSFGQPVGNETNSAPTARRLPYDTSAKTRQESAP